MTFIDFFKVLKSLRACLTMLLKSISRPKCFLGQKKAFGNILKSAFESSKKHLEFFFFFEKHLRVVFLKKTL